MATQHEIDDWTRRFLGSDQAPRGTQAIRRAFLILRIVALGGDNGCGLSEISAETGLARPTVRRILMALMAEGAVEQRPRTQRYRAPRHAELLEFTTQTSPLLRETNALLDEAAAEIGDNVSLTVRSGLDTVCVARRLGNYPVQVISLGVGVRRPIGATSSSLAILSTLPADEGLWILQENLHRAQEKKLTIGDILAQVERARLCGYAYRDRGLVQGTRALSIPISAADGRANATLTVSAIARRIPPQRLVPILAVLRATSERLEGLIANTSDLTDVAQAI